MSQLCIVCQAHHDLDWWPTKVIALHVRQYCGYCQTLKEIVRDFHGSLAGWADSQMLADSGGDRWNS
jgi:hypothetical protein